MAAFNNLWIVSARKETKESTQIKKRCPKPVSVPGKNTGTEGGCYEVLTPGMEGYGKLKLSHENSH